MSDVYAIVYNVWISGKKLGLEKKQCIQSISVNETDLGADSASLVIYDPEFRYIDDNIFLEDNKIKIEFGWDISTFRSTFEGYISAIDIDFGSDGIPVITMTCMDNTHRMNRTKRNMTYKNCTSGEIAQAIATRYGYACVVESNYDFVRNDTYTQSNQTDIDFLTKLAGDEVYPFSVRLVGNTLYYVKSGKLTSPVMTLTYRGFPHEIITFKPKINKEQRKNVENSALNEDTKAVETSTGTTDTGTGKPTENGSNSNDKTNNYTYNPNTKTWTKNKE